MSGNGLPAPTVGGDNGVPTPTLVGDLDAGIFHATRDNRRAFAANASLGDPNNWLGGIVERVTRTRVTREHDPDEVFPDLVHETAEEQLSRPHAHYRLRWACLPEEAWLIGIDPRWVTDEDELTGYRPSMLAAPAEGVVRLPVPVELPVTCDTCGHLLDGPGRRRDDGRTAVVPVPAGVSLVLAALCCLCVDSLLSPQHLVSWNALT